jgi:hypothetical protein
MQVKSVALIPPAEGTGRTGPDAITPIRDP